MDIIVTYTDESIFNGENTAFRGSKTPAQADGYSKMRLLRINSMDDIPEGCEILGTYEDVFADPDRKAVYDSIYPREYTYTNEAGNTVTGMKPERFGEFA